MVQLNNIEYKQKSNDIGRSILKMQWGGGEVEVTILYS